MLGMFSKNKFKSISVNDIDYLFGKINLIDIREDYEYKAGHVPGAKNISMSTILAQPDKYLNMGKEYHIICQSGGRSLRACEELTLKGFKVVNVSGGTGSYAKPLEK